MANTQINTRIILRNDTATAWASSNIVPLKGEMCVESDTSRFKFGDGVNVYADLPYANMTLAEIQETFGECVKSVSMATGSSNGQVAITVDGVTTQVSVKGLGSAAYKTAGSSNGNVPINGASLGTTANVPVVTNTSGALIPHASGALGSAAFTSSSAYAAASHGTHVSYSTSNPVMDGTASPGTASTVARSDHKHPTDTTRASVTDFNAHKDNSTIHVTAADKEKWNAKQAALTIDSTLSTTSTNPIQNKPVATALNTKAPLASPALTGTPTAPTAAVGTNSTQIATTAFVSAEISSKLSVSDAMVFKGTFGTSGTMTSLKTSGNVIGDTYKVITDGTISASNSYSGKQESVKIGDLIVAMTDAKWLVVPSGDERETTIKYATSGVNLSTTAQTGNVIVGQAATKQVDTSVSDSSTSTNLPTTKAVAEYVKGKADALSSSISTVSSNLSSHTGNKSNPHGVTKAQVGLGSVDNTADANKNVLSATKLTTARTIGLSGAVTGTATSFNGTANITIATTKLNTDFLANGSNVLVICGGDASN